MNQNTGKSKSYVGIIVLIVVICVVLLAIVMFFLLKGDGCDEITDGFLRVNCESCSESENPSKCRDEVFLTFASLKSDLSFCKKIKEKDKEDYCLAVLTGNQAVSADDISLCGSVSDTSACEDWFYYKEKMCEEISDASLKEQCETGGFIGQTG